MSNRVHRPFLRPVDTCGEPTKCEIYGLSSDNQEIVPLSIGAKQDYDKSLAQLPAGERRWAVYGLEFEKVEGERREAQDCPHPLAAGHLHGQAENDLHEFKRCPQEVPRGCHSRDPEQ